MVWHSDKDTLENSNLPSLWSFQILAILKDEDRTSKLKSFVDQGLLQYPEDLVMQMALLSKTCVDDDPSSRPDMKHIVIALSQMLLSSREWEAAEEGNSQIFSDLYQGR
eukprot:Gb_16105 [translate_table: standard]